MFSDELEIFKKVQSILGQFFYAQTKQKQLPNMNGSEKKYSHNIACNCQQLANFLANGRSEINHSNLSC